MIEDEEEVMSSSASPELCATPRMVPRLAHSDSLRVVRPSTLNILDVPRVPPSLPSPLVEERVGRDRVREAAATAETQESNDQSCTEHYKAPVGKYDSIDSADVPLKCLSYSCKAPREKRSGSVFSTPPTRSRSSSVRSDSRQGPIAKRMAFPKSPLRMNSSAGRSAGHSAERSSSQSASRAKSFTGCESDHTMVTDETHAFTHTLAEYNQQNADVSSCESSTRPGSEKMKKLSTFRSGRLQKSTATSSVQKQHVDGPVREYDRASGSDRFLMSDAVLAKMPEMSLANVAVKPPAYRQPDQRRLDSNAKEWSFVSTLDRNIVSEPSQQHAFHSWEFTEEPLKPLRVSTRSSCSAASLKSVELQASGDLGKTQNSPEVLASKDGEVVESLSQPTNHGVTQRHVKFEVLAAALDASFDSKSDEDASYEDLKFGDGQAKHHGRKSVCIERAASDVNRASSCAERAAIASMARGQSSSGTSAPRKSIAIDRAASTGALESETETKAASSALRKRLVAHLMARDRKSDKALREARLQAQSMRPRAPREDRVRQWGFAMDAFEQSGQADTSAQREALSNRVGSHSEEPDVDLFVKLTECASMEKLAKDEPPASENNVMSNNQLRRSSVKTWSELRAYMRGVEASRAPKNLTETDKALLREFDIEI